jgi:hypothetical protein
MTSRHEDRDGTSTVLLGWGREMSRALFIHWLRIHARTPVHSHDHDDRVTSVLATRSHRCALSEPHFRLCVCVPVCVCVCVSVCVCVCVHACVIA